MSDTPKQSPLGVNSLSSVLQNQGLHINSVAAGFMGNSSSYVTTGGTYTLGSLCDSTVLRMVTYSINEAFNNTQITPAVYNNLISIGSTSVPAFGNSKPPSYDYNVSTGRFSVSYNWAPSGWGGVNQYVSTTTKQPISSWGYVRLHALQAHGEFNYNESLPEYQDFLASFIASYGFVEQSNSAIIAVNNATDFLDGIYSNMNDLISADITGISLATVLFGQDLIASGNAIDFSSIATFGLPSNLLKTLKKNNATTDAVNLAILSSGITFQELNKISGNTTASAAQERNLYGAFSVITGDDLKNVLIPLNCKTKGLESLADLLNPKKLFPTCYRTLTVPIYNTEPGPTNSKTYYPIYSQSGVNRTLSSPEIAEKIGPQTPIGTPPIVEPSIQTIPIIEIPQVQESQIASGADSSPYPATPTRFGGGILDRNQNITLSEK